MVRTKAVFPKGGFQADSDLNATNPLDDYASLRSAARRWKRSPTTLARVFNDLQIPFVIVNGRKLYRLSAVTEKLREREIALGQPIRRRGGS